MLLGRLLIIPLVITISSIAFAEEPSLQQVSCLSHGESSNIGGVPGSQDWTLDPECCAGLVDRETIQVCGKAYGGGYPYVCLKCGDKNCDPKVENSCNCPEDCSNHKQD